MENSNVKENLEVLFEKFKNMIKVETVVGEAVQIGDTTLVPFVDVTFGFGTGTNHCTANKSQESGGGGGGADLHYPPAGDAPAATDAHRQPLCHHEGQGVAGAGAAAGQMALGGRGGGGGLAVGDHRRAAARRGAARLYLQLGRRGVAVG